MNQKMQKNLHNEKGIVLLGVFFTVAILSIISIGLFSRQNVFLDATERAQNRTIAFNLAEGGLAQAVANLKLDTSYTGNNYTDMSTYSIKGGYQVAVTTPGLSADVRMIQATGYSPSNISTDRAYQSRALTAYAELEEESYFDFAVFSKESMQINGNSIINSYNSLNGNYGGANIFSNGDIGTNSTTNGTVTLNGNVTVNGDAEVGPNATPSDVISGIASITGTTSAASKEKNYPSLTTDQSSLGPMSISGRSTVTLASGTYHYSSLDIKGQGTLNLSGPTVIFVSGPVDIAGNGIATSSNSPPNLIIYVITDDTVKITGNGNFYGGIYAPDSHVQVSGNGDLYGAVVANTYHQAGNGDVHFDEALTDTGKTGESSINILSWQENNTMTG